MIWRDKAEKAFMDYAGKYDSSDPLIASKIDHTLRVARNAERIASIAVALVIELVCILCIIRCESARE
ncbi:MAG: hypothetical protein K6G83_03065 [Lachnospiraceae bacterium]|nr:hypothetical protein [Lachnospiraceae bacterium]